LNIFEPSTLLAIFPYVFISAFPIFGLLLITYWLVKDKRMGKKEKEKEK
jgi:Na+/H+ antiporter NhaC